MAGVLLDTCVIAALVGDPGSLSDAMRAALAQHTGSIYASTASGMELAWHERDGRVRLPVPVADLAPHLQASGITVLPVTWEELATAVTVPVPHRDPFDRILAATALRRGLTLLTSDENVRQCPGMSCVW
ncbi:MAG: type II toxin-antitoxin system VapC family toxin [Deltaproteobacteria bacterium]|nr:type II toxin-antitoxin system VapC family toxin [Deltaproteobacteria bacterium]